MAKKPKTQDPSETPDQTNPAIVALAEILPELEYIEIIHVMQYVMKEVGRRHTAE
jgi:hypothetical protein